MITPTSTVAANSTTSAAQGAAAAASSAASVNYNSFLQLLMTEMQNQDPTQPMDPTQTVTQLATFTGVQQSVQTNSLLTSMLTNSSLAQASSMVGQTVTSADGTVSGVVQSVSTDSNNGLTATLTNGSTLALTSGVTIS